MKPQPLHMIWLDGREYLMAQRLALDFRIRAAMEIPLICREGSVWGFVHDGGSIPRFAWPVVGHPLSKLLPAFIKHDYSWSFRDMVGLTFGQTNDELYHDCRACGATMVRAYAIYRSVQTFGAGRWKHGAGKVGNLDWHFAPIPGGNL